MHFACSNEKLGYDFFSMKHVFFFKKKQSCLRNIGNGKAHSFFTLLRFSVSSITNITIIRKFMYDLARKMLLTQPMETWIHNYAELWTLLYLIFTSIVLVGLVKLVWSHYKRCAIAAKLSG